MIDASHELEEWRTSIMKGNDKTWCWSQTASWKASSILYNGRNNFRPDETQTLSIEMFQNICRTQKIHFAAKDKYFDFIIKQKKEKTPGKEKQ